MDWKFRTAVAGDQQYLLGYQRWGCSCIDLGRKQYHRVDVRENSFRRGVGIQATENTLIRNNSFTRASTAIFSAGEVRNNVIREGVNGIVALSTTSIIDNRILLVSGSGITMGASSTTRGNYLYNNATGISATGFTGVIANNFLVNNTTAGIAIASGSPTLTNNTIIQATGDAIRVMNVGTQNVNVRNNILQVSSGYALNVDSAASPVFKVTTTSSIGSAPVASAVGKTATTTALPIGITKLASTRTVSLVTRCSWIWMVPTICSGL